MNSLNHEEARGRSKERVRAEIDLRRDEIRSSEEWVSGMDQGYAANRYRNAEPGWSRGAEEYQMRLHNEISFLMSLL